MNSINFWDETFGKWTDILSYFVDSKYLQIGKSQGCPVCGDGKDRYRYHDNGIGQWFCTRCAPNRNGNCCHTGGDMLMMLKGWDFATLIKEVTPLIGLEGRFNKKPEVDKMFRVRQIYQESEKLEGTLAERYLKTRCILPKADWTRDLLYHPSLFVPDSISEKDKSSPALVAITRSSEMVACGVQVTFLNENAEKAYNKRWNYGAVGNGVWIGPRETKMKIVISEGLETLLSSIYKTGLPGWACLGKGTFKSFTPAIGCGHDILVYGDNDKSFAGQTAAYQMAERLNLQGVKCSVFLPPNPGTDWNDVDRDERYLVQERLGIKEF